MIVTPDTNLLVFAVDANSPRHTKAKAWLEGLFTDEQVAIVMHSSVVFGFLRIITSRRIFKNPLSVDEAQEYIDNWFANPKVSWEFATIGDLQTAVALMRPLGVGGDLVADAQIAAMAMRLRATVHTADRDFARFDGVAWHNPLA